MNEMESTKRRFMEALFRIHQAFNQLDLNLGLAIRLIENPEDVARSHHWLASANVGRKIDRVHELLVDRRGKLEELDQWRDRAHRLRMKRNLYAHSFFYSGYGAKKGLWYSILVPPWMRREQEEDFSVEGVEDFAKEAEDVCTKFDELRRKALGF